MGTIKQNIDLGIEKLLELSNELKKELGILWSTCQDKDKIQLDSSKVKELFDKADEIAEQVVSLKHYNKALYANRGKGSFKKKISSKENGKLGGRPPKEISNQKKRIAELENKSDLSDGEKEELEKLRENVSTWKNQKIYNIK